MNAFRGIWWNDLPSLDFFAKDRTKDGASEWGFPSGLPCTYWDFTSVTWLYCWYHDMLTSIILGGNAINCWKLGGHGQILQADFWWELGEFGWFLVQSVAGMEDIRSKLVAGTISGTPTVEVTITMVKSPWNGPICCARNVETPTCKTNKCRGHCVNPPNNTMIAATKIVWIIWPNHFIMILPMISQCNMDPRNTDCQMARPFWSLQKPSSLSHERIRIMDHHFSIKTDGFNVGSYIHKPSPFHHFCGLKMVERNHHLTAVISWYIGVDRGYREFADTSIGIHISTLRTLVIYQLVYKPMVDISAILMVDISLDFPVLPQILFHEKWCIAVEPMKWMEGFDDPSMAGKSIIFR